MSLHIVHSFSLLYSVPACKYTTIHLFILLLIDFHAVSSMELLEIILLYTFLYMSLGNWYIFVGAGLQDNTVCIHSVDGYLQTGFQELPIHSCASNESSSALSTVCFSFRHSVRYIAALHCGCNWHFAHKVNIVLYCPFVYIDMYLASLSLSCSTWTLSCSI